MKRNCFRDEHHQSRGKREDVCWPRQATTENYLFSVSDSPLKDVRNSRARQSKRWDKTEKDSRIAAGLWVDFSYERTR